MLGLSRFAGAGAAAAHATRIAADPAADAAVAQGPPRVSATFNEQLQTTFAAMTVVGPDGNLWSTGSRQVQGAVGLGRPAAAWPDRHVHRQLPGDLGRRARGDRGVVVSADGRRIGRPGAARRGGQCGLTAHLPVWPFVAVAVVIVGAGALVGGAAAHVTPWRTSGGGRRPSSPPPRSSPGRWLTHRIRWATRRSSGRRHRRGGHAWARTWCRGSTSRATVRASREGRGPARREFRGVGGRRTGSARRRSSAGRRDVGRPARRAHGARVRGRAPPQAGPG